MCLIYSKYTKLMQKWEMRLGKYCLISVTKLPHIYKSGSWAHSENSNLHSSLTSELRRVRNSSLALWGLMAYTVQRAHVVPLESCDVTRASTSRDTLGSLHIWFWINFWSLRAQEPFTFAKLLTIFIFSHMTSQEALNHGWRSSDVGDQLSSEAFQFT